MANWLWFSKIHAKVFQLSGGRLGARLAGIDMVFIDTIGRKSGQVRTIPMACYPYQDDVVVSASNNGLDTDPVWWLNLQANPEVEIQLGTQRFKARAEALDPEARAAFWPQVVKLNPPQAHHQKKTSRVIPLIRLRKLAALN